MTKKCFQQNLFDFLKKKSFETNINFFRPNFLADSAKGMNDGEIKYFETLNEESEGVDSKKIKLDRWYM